MLGKVNRIKLKAKGPEKPLTSQYQTNTNMHTEYTHINIVDVVDANGMRVCDLTEW